MKKVLSFAMALTVGAIATAQTNLVVNGDFETGTLAPWQKGYNSQYTEPTVDVANARTGGYGAGYSASKVTGFYQEIPIQPNAQYTLSFWYKTSGTGLGTRLWSYFLGTGNNGATTTVNYATNTTDDPLRTHNGYLTSADWTQHVVPFTTPANVQKFIYAVRAYTNSNVSFDDFELVAGTQSTVDFSKSRFSLVKYTQVSDVIEFAKNSPVKIYNMSSQLVKDLKVKAGETVSVADLEPGMYIVTGVVNGEKVSQKILKK